MSNQKADDWKHHKQHKQCGQPSRRQVRIDHSFNQRIGTWASHSNWLGCGRSTYNGGRPCSWSARWWRCSGSPQTRGVSMSILSLNTSSGASRLYFGTSSDIARERRARGRARMATHRTINPIWGHNCVCGCCWEGGRRGRGWSRWVRARCQEFGFIGPWTHTRWTMTG